MEEKQVLAEIQKQERQLSTYWRSLHWHVCAVLAAGTAAAEILLFFVLDAASLISCSVPVYLIRYIAVPSLINGALVWGCRWLIRTRDWDETKKDGIVSLTMTLLCFVITIIHGAFSSVYMMFVLPTLLTTVYERKQLTVVTALTGMVLCGLSAFMPSWDPDKIVTAYYFSDILICLMVQAGTLAACWELLEFQDRRRQISRRRDAERISLQREVSYDALTGVGSRMALNRCFEELETAQDYALVLLDLDDFKQINDQLGHLIGDEVLRQVGQLLNNDSERMRAYRFGGDEFCVVLKQPQSDEAERCMRQLQEQFSQRMRELFPKFPMTISLGIHHQQGGESALQCFRHADEALYKAKKQGKNQLASN